MTLSKETIGNVIEKLEHFAQNLKWTDVRGAQDLLAAADGLRELMERRGRDGQVPIDKTITPYFDTLALDTAREIMCDVNRRSELLGGDVQLLARIQCRIDEVCRTAMLQSFGNSEQLNSPAVPDGWVAVPVKPTKEMLGQIHPITEADCPDCGKRVTADCEDNVLMSWEDMLAAAPTQESE